MKNWLTKIYNILPAFVQNWAISLYGIYWFNRRYGGVFQAECKKFKFRENYTFQQWTDFQNRELRKLVLHVFDTVPYYELKYKKFGISREFIENELTIHTIHKLPPLEKDDLRKFGDSTLLSSKCNKKAPYFYSSGSTGTPTKIKVSKKMQQTYAAANETRSRNWAGVNLKDSRGMIGGRRILKDAKIHGEVFRINKVENQVYFSAYHISRKNIDLYQKAFQKYPITYMTGYAKANYFLAKLFLENNIKVKPLKAVITSSEKLTPEMRKVFAEVYGCKTFDGYSGVEACGMITENEFGQLLISPDIGIMEVLKEDGSPCLPGEIGEIYSTGFLNYDQPLIRYRIGDMVKLALDQNTKCGRNMIVVEEIIGRVEDTVIGPDGRQMVRFHGIFIDLPNIVEGQIIQHDLDQFEIKVVSTKELTLEEKNTLSKRMTSQLGEIEIQIVRVDQIDRNANGKFQAVVSHIKHLQKSSNFN